MSRVFVPEMAKPDIVFVAGFWEGSRAFDVCAGAVSAAGYSVHIVSLLSTGSISKQASKPVGMKDDVAHIRSSIIPLIDEGHSVLLVLHSAAGFLGSNAVEGLSRSSRVKSGQQGGVVRLAFVAGAVFPEGYHHGPLPFFDFKVGFCIP